MTNVMMLIMTRARSTIAFRPNRSAIAPQRGPVTAEVSAAICFLLSPASAFITGITLAIDGGAPLGNAVMDMGDYKPAPAFEGFHRATTPAALTADEG